MKINKFIIYSIYILFPFCTLAQDFDVKAFQDVAKKSFLECRKREKNDKLTYIHTELADTNYIEFHLPILMIKEPERDYNNFMFLTPFIDKFFSPFNQYAVIKSKNNYLKLGIKEGVYDEIVRLRNEWGVYIPPKDDYIKLSRGANIYLQDTDFFDCEKYYNYELTKEYSDCHPDVVLFLIHELPGIWGFRNNKLIKLKFTRKQIEELDGEEYYRNFLFPLSPQGLKRIIEGESFRVVITI